MDAVKTTRELCEQVLFANEQTDAEIILVKRYLSLHEAARMALAVLDYEAKHCNSDELREIADDLRAELAK